MSFPGLTIIGERINPGYASSKKLLDARDIAGLQELARTQVAKGAAYLNINVGQDAEKDAGFMVEVVKAVQQVVDVPLSMDSPAAHVQAACMAVYDPARARGRGPVMNSVAENRWEMIRERRHDAQVLFMVSERVENGQPVPNRTAAEVLDTTRRLIARAKAEIPGFTNGHAIIDVSVAPMASDTEGLSRMAVEGIRAVNACPELAGVHMSVGLSNLGIMLPKKEVGGLPLSIALESAFLTCTVPHGLDMALATAGRSYLPLAADHPALVAFKEIIELDGYDGIRRLRKLYAAA